VDELTGVRQNRRERFWTTRSVGPKGYGQDGHSNLTLSAPLHCGFASVSIDWSKFTPQCGQLSIVGLSFANPRDSAQDLPRRPLR